jgi:hypothetical protein
MATATIKTPKTIRRAIILTEYIKVFHLKYYFLYTVDSLTLPTLKTEQLSLLKFWEILSNFGSLKRSSQDSENSITSPANNIRAKIPPKMIPSLKLVKYDA